MACSPFFYIFIAKKNLSLFLIADHEYNLPRLSRLKNNSWSLQNAWHPCGQQRRRKVAIGESLINGYNGILIHGFSILLHVIYRIPRLEVSYFIINASVHLSLTLSPRHMPVVFLLQPDDDPSISKPYNVV